jgi:adenosylcobinamide-phosphate synthase
VYWCLANRGLIQESYAVIKALKKEGLEAGRKKLSYIVGRDTTQLNEQQVRTAVLETMAENLSDGVVAPLFFFAIGGVPAMMAYKMASTLDSMIAYKSPRYKEFGWFAATLDDVLNYIPARLTAFLMVILSFSWRGFAYIFRYGHKHASPNAGYPEAALAGILNTRFGGPNVYNGELVQKPYLGTNARELSDKDFYITTYINIAVCVAMISLVILERHV